ncbi:hypothetical protein [Paucibacter sp. DJ2R-2]|uniref:hypothetical protein n=1 Tax=Paucibacter sp. DJ2R-2 TaxID=2893558 RepID=UPI0021E46500|nr:hypothetical protein [Paucibacter sp. DJ2R-2]MCV2421618.1 hypothetical protein [Paucibacter sp. DJ4R-1]MCV2438323.1 hypothetical protein [Paucibacter sp. DJ2R-2]
MVFLLFAALTLACLLAPSWLLRRGLHPLAAWLLAAGMWPTSVLILELLPRAPGGGDSMLLVALITGSLLGLALAGLGTLLALWRRRGH